MNFGNDTWYILATTIGVMIIVIGTLITVIAKYIVINPITELKTAIDMLIKTINELHTFIEVQKVKNKEDEAKIKILFEKVDRNTDDIQNLKDRK